jgi:DNA modification methylase
MQIEMRPITSIRPYQNNPRINDAAVDAVAASIQKFGFRQPIVVDSDGIIVVGHTRYKAALKLGMTLVPVHVAHELTPTEAKAYRIADNQTATLSSWDEFKLPQELAALQNMQFELDFTGFCPEELERLINATVSSGLTDPDAVPDPPDAPTTEPGDLIRLGKHQLLCGDSGKSEDVDRLLDGAKIHLVNTAPPYNVKVEPGSNNAIAAGPSSFPSDELKQKKLRNKTSRTESLKHHQALDLARQPQKAKPTKAKMRAKDRPLADDFGGDEECDRLLEAWFSNIARVLLPGRAFWLWGGYANIANYPAALQAAGLHFSQAVIWVKEHPVRTRKDMMGNHEWCFYGWREGAAHHWYGPANIPDVWLVKNASPQNMIHVTEKPTELAVRTIEYSTCPGENVLDLFGGGGSTLIAAEKTGRRAFLMELDPLYCDVIITRYEQFSGQKAERVARH